MWFSDGAGASSPDADIVQLVEHDFAKVEVAGSRPAVCSIRDGVHEPITYGLFRFAGRGRRQPATLIRWRTQVQFLVPQPVTVRWNPHRPMGANSHALHPGRNNRKRAGHLLIQEILPVLGKARRIRGKRQICTSRLAVKDIALSRRRSRVRIPSGVPVADGWQRG